MANDIFRDPAVKSFDSFRVTFDGKLCSPQFNSRGAAAAYLDLLERGLRRPELCSFYETPPSAADV